MNAEEMLDFALGQLDDPRSHEFEEAGRTDPEFAARAHRIRQTLHHLVDDGYTFPPPSDLSRRTLALVADTRRRRRSILDYVPAQLPFRWADFAVAASIFVAGVLTLLPAIQKSRERMNQAGCMFNLAQIGMSLGQYAKQNPSYPYPPDHRTDAHSGLYAAILHDAGLLSDLSVLDCPSNGTCAMHDAKHLDSFDQIDDMRKTDPAQYQKLVSWDYGYNVGYRRDSGRPGPLEARPASLIAVIADQPPPDAHLGVIDRNSPNHGGAGQNVLYSDGGVRWHSNRRMSPKDRDLYLNNARQMQPGPQSARRRRPARQGPVHRNQQPLSGTNRPSLQTAITTTTRGGPRVASFPLHRSTTRPIPTPFRRRVDPGPWT